MSRSVKNLRGGKKELMDFLDEFSFEKMRDKSKKVKGKGKSFIDGTANSIRKTSKKVVKTLRLNKLFKTSKNLGTAVVKKSTNLVRKGSKMLIKKRPRRKVSKHVSKPKPKRKPTKKKKSSKGKKK
tara:strand:- start:472 stop:849 length:378 start_codon:yes stop_codon:yes gene_type:complete